MEFNFKNLISNYFTKFDDKKKCFEMICNGNTVSGVVIDDKYYLHTAQLASIFDISLEEINTFKKQKESEYRKLHKAEKVENKEAEQVESENKVETKEKTVCPYFSKLNYINTDIVVECLYSCSDKFRNFVDNYMLYGMFNSKVNILQSEPNDFKTSQVQTNLPTPKKVQLVVKQQVEMTRCLGAQTSKDNKDSLYIKKFKSADLDEKYMYPIKTDKVIKPDSEDAKKLFELISNELGVKDCCVGITTGKLVFKEGFIFDKSKIDINTLGKKVETLIESFVEEPAKTKSKKTKDNKTEEEKEKPVLKTFEEVKETKAEQPKKVNKFAAMKINEEAFSDDEDFIFDENKDKEEVTVEVIPQPKKTTKKTSKRTSKK